VDEAQLIDRVLSGDPSAERAMYDAHVDRVYRLVYRMVGDADTASDCVQDTFIKAFDRLGDFRRESALGSWIGAIAVSVALNALRTRKRLASRHVPIDFAEEAGASGHLGEPDLRSGMHRAIDALPDGYRTVFVMHDIEGYTHEEIGRTLSITSGTSKAQLFRARARLRQALSAHAPE
jgi:RNA polymerase sigma-70 factor (ECF subfamily)